MTPIMTILAGAALLIFGVLLIWSWQFREIMDGDPLEEDYWFAFDPTPTESLRAYGRRIGLSEKLLDTILLEAYNRCIECFKGDREGREFYPFVIAMTLAIAVDRGETGWKEVAEEYRSDAVDPIHALTLTAVDWKFFVRMPKLWSKIDGRKKQIDDAIFSALADQDFQLGSYTGQLHRYL